MRVIKNSKCILCGYEGEMKIKSFVEKRNIIRCPNCEIQFMYPFPTDEEINNIYSRDYFSSWGIGEGETVEVSDMKRNTFKHILNGITPYVNNGNILDIGTATGFLLEEAEKLGFNAYGIEISEYASSIAKNKFGKEKIYNGTLETCGFKNNYFNLITMCDVIEHIKDPISTLKIVNRLLNTTNSNGGGVLHDYYS